MFIILKYCLLKLNKCILVHFITILQSLSKFGKELLVLVGKNLKKSKQKGFFKGKDNLNKTFTDGVMKFQCSQDKINRYFLGYTIKL